MLETSYLVMETHANSTPVQVYATCMCLPKRKAKEHGHYQKILPRRLTTIWQRKAIWKTLFQNKSSGTINPVYLPQKLLNNTKNCVNQKNTVYHKSCPILLSCNLGGTSHEQPWPYSSSVLENMQWKEMHQLLDRTWGGMILKGIFSSNFWNLRMLKNNLLNSGMYADQCSPLCYDRKCRKFCIVHLWKNCLSQLAHYLYPATLEEHPMNNHDPDRVLSWKSCNGDLEMTRNVHNQKLWF